MVKTLKIFSRTKKALRLNLGVWHQELEVFKFVQMMIVGRPLKMLKKHFLWKCLISSALFSSPGRLCLSKYYCLIKQNFDHIFCYYLFHKTCIHVKLEKNPNKISLEKKTIVSYLTLFSLLGFHSFQKVSLCLWLYTEELNLQTFFMIKWKTFLH